MKPMAGFRWVAATTLALGTLMATQASAQVPGRFYWKGLTDANAAPLIFNSISGNTNPFDPGHTVTPGAKIDATMALMGYARTFALGERSAMAAVLLPMGRLSGDLTTPTGKSASQSASGFGDPTLELDVNILGPKAQKNLVDALRYEPGFSVDLLADLALPIGEYNSNQTLNIGQNRWYGRLGAPVVWQLGDWVPGRRTTLEFLPAAWMFGNNTNYVGQTLKTDPLFQLDSHLTRDFTENFWAAIDASWYNGGKSSINGVEGKKLSNAGWGLTFGYKLNENASLTFGYKSTVNDSAPDAMRMDSFMITLVFGWHPLIEGARRLKGEN